MNFTREQLALFTRALFNLPDTGGKDRLERILIEWGRIDLEQHLRLRDPKTLKAERKRLRSISRTAGQLAQLISELDRTARFLVAGSMLGGFEPIRAGPEIHVPKHDFDHSQVRELDVLLGNEPEALRRVGLAAAHAAGLLPTVSSRHNTLVGYLILRDLAAIFEYATEEKASRRTRIEPHPEAGQPYGRFWVFVSAIWPVIFGSSGGLKSAIKSWAAERRKSGERSPIMLNLDLHHPLWQLFDREHQNPTFPKERKST